MLRKLALSVTLIFILSASICLAQETQANMSTNPVPTMPSQADLANEARKIGNFTITPVTKNTVEKSWIMAEMKPGDTMEDAVIVTNTNPYEITLKLRASDGLITQDGQFTIQASDKTPVELGSWVTLSQIDLVLQANEAKEVKYSIHVPETTAYGEYKGGIAAMQTGTRSANGIIISTTVAYPVKITVTNDPQPIPKMPPEPIVKAENYLASILSLNNYYFWGSLALFIVGISYFIYGTISERKKKKQPIK